jgi:hypothetical protein
MYDDAMIAVVMTVDIACNSACMADCLFGIFIVIGLKVFRS